MENIYLESERLVLRPFVEGDIPLLVDLDNDSDVMKFINGGFPSTFDDRKAMFSRTLGFYQKYNHKFGVWIAIEKNTSNFVGWFILRPDKTAPDNLENLELGYRLKKSFWGKGFATEMSKKLLDKAFRELNAKTVFAMAIKENSASVNVMVKLQMKFHSSFFENQFPGKDKSAVRYSISRSEYEDGYKSN